MKAYNLFSYLVFAALGIVYLWIPKEYYFNVTVLIGLSQLLLKNDK